jgi:hypothetical protein
MGKPGTNTSRRERLDTPTGSHFAKRTAKGQFKGMDSVGRSLKTDGRIKAKRTVKSGHGDQRDRKRLATHLLATTVVVVLAHARAA